MLDAMHKEKKHSPFPLCVVSELRRAQSISFLTNKAKSDKLNPSINWMLALAREGKAIDREIKPQIHFVEENILSN
ncbi:MAG: hypothetical protein AAFP00_06250 [Bacteroidota bacterium]